MYYIIVRCAYRHSHTFMPIKLTSIRPMDISFSILKRHSILYMYDCIVFMTVVIVIVITDHVCMSWCRTVSSNSMDKWPPSASTTTTHYAMAATEREELFAEFGIRIDPSANIECSKCVCEYIYIYIYIRMPCSIVWTIRNWLYRIAI